MQEETSDRENSAWLTHLPFPLVPDGSDNFLQSFPPKTEDNGSSKRASIGIEAGDLFRTVWWAAAFSAIVGGAEGL